jgi:hypothetical protein
MPLKYQYNYAFGDTTAPVNLNNPSSSAVTESYLLLLKNKNNFSAGIQSLNPSC